MVRQLIAWTVPGAPTARACLPHTVDGLAEGPLTLSVIGHYMLASAVEAALLNYGLHLDDG